MSASLDSRGIYNSGHLSYLELPCSNYLALDFKTEITVLPTSTANPSSSPIRVNSTFTSAQCVLVAFDESKTENLDFYQQVEISQGL